MSKSKPKPINQCCNQCGHPAGLIGYTYTEETNGRLCFVLCNWSKALVGQYRPYDEINQQSWQSHIGDLEGCIAKIDSEIASQVERVGDIYRPKRRLRDEDTARN